jgi:hypothetical protein
MSMRIDDIPDCKYNKCPHYSRFKDGVNIFHLCGKTGLYWPKKPITVSCILELMQHSKHPQN